MLAPEVPSERENKVSYSDIEKNLSGLIGVNPELLLRKCQPYMCLSRIDTRYVLFLRCFMNVDCRVWKCGCVSGVAILLLKWSYHIPELNHRSLDDIAYIQSRL
jgi:hypothetical protein